MGSLSQEEQRKLCELRTTDPFVDETLRQVNCILASQTFLRLHQTTKDFLVFVVAMQLLVQIEQIKEMIIAIRVWKDTDFDPLLTSKIRTAARNLRAKIAEYYRTEGQRDLIEICLPHWGYVPDIRDRRLAIDVALFENRNPNGDQQYLCDAVTDDIVYLLANAGAIEAKRVETLACTSSAHYGLSGILFCRDDTVKLNVWLQDLRARRIIWDPTFEGCRDDLLKLSQQVAGGARSILRPETMNPLASNVEASRRPGSTRYPPGRSISAASLERDMA
jgi:TolB-like protein